MGLKEILTKIRNNRSERKEELKRMIEQRRLQEFADNRFKSSDERDLEKRLEKKRQELIKQRLNQLREQDKKELWRKNIIKQKNIFQGHKSVLEGNKKLFTTKSKLNQKGMFFK